MSRLLSILAEQKKQAVLNERAMVGEITGKVFKRYTDAGNLFRLMLVTSPDGEFPTVGKLDLVSKMLPDLSADNEKTVKKLQTSFNEMKKIIKKDKKPTSAMKKKYYTLLFSLLLPLTSAQANFKLGTLVNQFASGSKTAQAFQRKATVLIGKSLLNSDAVELNTKDRQVIKGYITGLDELDTEETTTLTNSEKASVELEDTATEELQPVSKIDTIVNDESTPEHLDDVIVRTETAVKAIENDILNHETRANAIKEILNTNKSSDFFKMEAETLEPQVKESINAKLKAVFENVEAAAGVQQANFITKFINDTLKNLNQVPGFLNFNADYITFNVRPGKDAFVINIKVGDQRNGDDELFFMDRTFYEGKDGLVVKNEQLQLPASLRGGSINKDLFIDALNLYKARGVDKIELEANVDVGGYAWFRYGFTPQDLSQIKSIALWMQKVLPIVYMGLQYDAADIASYIVKKAHNKSKDVMNLGTLLEQGQSEDAQIVLTKLASSAAKEFISRYKDKESFKTMQSDLSLMNFKPVSHKGKTYTMSYKALLSIQALKDDTGFSIVPMTNGVHLNWLGELKMNDLEDTYSYLNEKKA